MKKIFYFAFTMLAVASFLLSTIPTSTQAASFSDGLSAFNEEDYETAFKIWESLARKGNPKAQFRLATMYRKGSGVSRNHKKAIKWFLLLAKQENKGIPEPFRAQMNLGYYYLRGESVEKNKTTALKWFLSASKGFAHYRFRRGERRSAREIVKLKQNMSEEEISNAERFLFDWKENHKKSTKDKRRKENALKKALEDKRRKDTALKKALEDKRRKDAALKKALEDKRRKDTALKKALEEKRRKDNALKKALEEKRRKDTARKKALDAIYKGKTPQKNKKPNTIFPNKPKKTEYFFWAGYQSKELECDECDESWEIKIKYSKDGKKYKADVIFIPGYPETGSGPCEGKVFANGNLEKTVCELENAKERMLGGSVTRLELFNTGGGNSGGAVWIDKNLLKIKKQDIVTAQKKQHPKKPATILKKVQKEKKEILTPKKKSVFTKTKSNKKIDFTKISKNTNIFLNDLQIFLQRNAEIPNLLEIAGLISKIKDVQTQKDIPSLQSSLNSLKKITSSVPGFPSFRNKRKNDRTLARKRLLENKIKLVRSYEKTLKQYIQKNILKDIGTVKKLLPLLKYIKIALKNPKLEELHEITNKTSAFILANANLKEVAKKLNIKQKAKKVHKKTQKPSVKKEVKKKKAVTPRKKKKKESEQTTSSSTSKGLTKIFSVFKKRPSPKKSENTSERKQRLIQTSREYQCQQDHSVHYWHFKNCKLWRPGRGSNSKRCSDVIHIKHPYTCYKGGLKNNQPHGYGTITVEKRLKTLKHRSGPFEGLIYKGNFKNGTFHGKGTATHKSYKYIGNWEKGIKKGKGVVSFDNGSRYSGGFENDQPHGQGTYHYHIGDKYVGGFKKNKRHGQGTYTWKNSKTYAKYVGNWKNNKNHGQGTEYLKNGDKYIGGFKNNLRHGKGTLILANGKKFPKKYINGKTQKEVTKTKNQNAKTLVIDTYVNYKFIQLCVNVRKNYAFRYITKSESANAKAKMRIAEKSFKKKFKRRTLSDLWDKAEKAYKKKTYFGFYNLKQFIEGKYGTRVKFESIKQACRISYDFIDEKFVSKKKRKKDF